MTPERFGRRVTARNTQNRTGEMNLNQLAKAFSSRRIPWVEAGIMRRFGKTYEEARALAQASRRRQGKSRRKWWRESDRRAAYRARVKAAAAAATAKAGIAPR